MIRFLSILILFLATPVFAAEYNAGGACASAGAFHTKNDASGVYHLICNGTIWVDTLAQNRVGTVGIGLGAVTPLTILEVAGTISSKGGSLYLQRPTSGGAWARGMELVPDSSFDPTGAGLAGIGFVGLSLGSPTARIYIAHGTAPWGSVNGITILSNGDVGLGTTAPSVALDVVGDINYTGVIVDVSDRRLKTAINPLLNSLIKTQSLKPVSFVMKDEEEKRKELGFIAQDVEEIFPELVVDNGEFKSLNYIGMIAPLVATVQERQIQIDELRRQNNALLTRIEALEGVSNE